MKTVLIGCLIFALAISHGNGLECYSCDSSQSALCNFGLTTFVMPTVNCDQQVGDSNIFTNLIPKQCVKFTAKDSEGKEFVARGCIPYAGGACDAIFSTLGFFSGISGGAKEVHCYPCNGDKCNSSVNIQPSVAATLILGVLLFFFRI